MEPKEPEIVIELLERFLRGESTPEELDVVEQWMRHANVSRAELEKLVAVPDGVAFLLSIDDATEWNLIKNRLPRKRQAFLQSTWYRAAAAVVGLVVLAAVYVLLRDSTEPMMTVYNEGATPREVSLPDGTNVSLRSGATLTYAKVFEGERKVMLVGEAYFDVVRDESRPFVVNAVGCDVRVLGTSFSVETDSSGTEVIVTSGSVSVNDGTHTPIVLQKGERAIDRPDTAPVSFLNDSPNFLSWKTGVLTFDNTPLSRVLNDLAEHFGMTFTFRENTAKAPAYTSRFKDPTAEEVLVEMKDVLGIDYVIDGNRVVITLH